MIDSHTHLASTPGSDAEIVAAARAAGVTRILTIGTDAVNSRAAQAAAEAHGEVWFAAGHHPNNASGYSDAHTDALREIAGHPRCAAIGETGLDDFRDYAPRNDQERAPWQLAKDEQQAAALDATLRSLAEGIRAVTVLLHPYMPETAAKLLEALGEEELALASAGFGARPGGRRVGKLAPLFPKPQ